MATKTHGTMSYYIGYSGDERVDIKRVEPEAEIGLWTRAWGRANAEDRNLDDGTRFTLMYTESKATYVAVVELENTRDVERTLDLLRLIRNGVFNTILDEWRRAKGEA